MARQLQGIVLVALQALNTVICDAFSSLNGLKVVLQVSTNNIKCATSLRDLADSLVIPALFGIICISL